MTLDLSAVTDSLIGLVKSQWTTAPIWAEMPPILMIAPPVRAPTISWVHLPIRELKGEVASLAARSDLKDRITTR